MGGGEGTARRHDQRHLHHRTGHRRVIHDPSIGISVIELTNITETITTPSTSIVQQQPNTTAARHRHHLGGDTMPTAVEGPPPSSARALLVLVSCWAPRALSHSLPSRGPVAVGGSRAPRNMTTRGSRGGRRGGGTTTGVIITSESRTGAWASCCPHKHTVGVVKSFLLLVAITTNTDRMAMVIRLI